MHVSSLYLHICNEASYMRARLAPCLCQPILCAYQEPLLFQVQALQTAMEESQQVQRRAGQEHQHALAALQGQLKNAAGEMDVLRAGAGHAKDQALAALKVK